MLKLIYPREAERWSGKPGNSICYPAGEEVSHLLKGKELEGIEYQQYEPCFGHVAEATVSVDKINSPIWEADRKLAEYWSEIRKDGRTWKTRDVRKYRKNKKLVWHRRWSVGLMDLLPKALHRHFSHSSARAFNKAARTVLSTWEMEDYGQKIRLCPHQNLVFITLLALLIRSFADIRIQTPTDYYLCFLAALLPYCVFLLLCRILGRLPEALNRRLCGLFMFSFFAGWTAFIPELLSLKFMTPLLCCFSLLLAVYLVQSLEPLLSVDQFSLYSPLRANDEDEEAFYDYESEDEE